MTGWDVTNIRLAMALQFDEEMELVSTLAQGCVAGALEECPSWVAQQYAANMLAWCGPVAPSYPVALGALT